MTKIEAIDAILKAQYPAGYWVSPGLGISPHYRATAWQILFLAQLDAEPTPAIQQGLQYLIRHNPDESGAFCTQLGAKGRSILITALILWAACKLGYRENPTLGQAWIWLKKQLTYTDYQLKPNEIVWVLRTAALWGEKQLLSPGVTQLVKSLEKKAETPWASDLYFPITDQMGLLDAMNALVEAGAATQLPGWTSDWLLTKQLPDNTWPLERIPGRLWWNPGPLGASNPWITQQAHKVLDAL